MSAGTLPNLYRKKFASIKTLDQHVQSKKHNPQALPHQESVESSKVKKTTVFRKNNKACLFCGVEAASFS